MKKKDILFIYPYYSYPRKSPPLGLAYLAAYIEQSGFRSHIHDFNIYKINEDDFKEMLLLKSWLLIGISFMTNQFAEALRLSAYIKKVLFDTPLVGGGPHPSSIPERTLKEISALDMIVMGEGEATLKELAEAIRAGNRYDQIPGLCFRKNGRIIKNKKRKLIYDLNRLQFPAWKYFDLKKI